MKKIIGIGLLGPGLIAFIYLINYQDAFLSFKWFWVILSLLVAAAGGYLLTKDSLEKAGKKANQSNAGRLAEIRRLKETGIVVRVTLDNAEVKSRIYHEETTNQGFPSQIEIIDGLANPNKNSKRREVLQTYILYQTKIKGLDYKFVSQATDADSTALKRFLDKQGGIDLYIDPNNPASYVFDLPF